MQLRSLLDLQELGGSWDLVMNSKEWCKCHDISSAGDSGILFTRVSGFIEVSPGHQAR